MKSGTLSCPPVSRASRRAWHMVFNPYQLYKHMHPSSESHLPTHKHSARECRGPKENTARSGERRGPGWGSWAASEGADEGGLSDSEGDRTAGTGSRREQDERKWRVRRQATRKFKVGPSALASS